MMDGLDAAAPHGAARVLVGIAAALGGAALCVLLGAGSAHADTGEPPEQGLLSGVVHSVADTVRTVDSTVTSVVAPVAAPAPAAPRPVPAPAAPAPAPAPTPAQSIVQPLATTVDRTVARVPVVGTLTSALVGSAPVAEITSPVSSLVDTTLGTVGSVVAPVGPLVSPVGGAAGDPLSVLIAGDATHDATAILGTASALAGVSATSVRTASDHLSAPAAGAISAPVSALIGATGPWSPGALSDGMLPVSAGAGAPAGGAGMLAGALLLGALLLSLRHRADRPAVPGSPVFDTDSSPD